MSIGISDDEMTCNATQRTARRGESGWQVSWLPGRTLTRDQAITAMVLTEVAALDPKPGDRIWPHAEAWAAELDVPGAAAAVSMARARDTRGAAIGEAAGYGPRPPRAGHHTERGTEHETGHQGALEPRGNMGVHNPGKGQINMSECVTGQGASTTIHNREAGE